MPTFTKLVASDGDLDTSNPVTLFEGFQKVFVVNGTKLKVADFINTKLTHSALTTAHAKGDILTQATSAATMVVDFTNTAKTATYGYVTSGTFSTSYQVTGSGSGTAFTPSAVTANPHWYDWTVYPGGSSGSMPTTAYLGCLYRGRCVLSGNVNYPYQWYMSRQMNPWDWAYTANDAQSPVAGNSADAGELGDIVKALIPYRDEYLIMGCAHSLWVMKGDPAANGVLEEVDLTKGVFGPQSWCFDSEGNLYFASCDGIYVLPFGFGPIMPLSGLVLPQMYSDFTVQPDTHVITLGYDKINAGILVCITKISDGDNVNYFYDLKTKGFFPEDYPNSCGAYSTFNYDAVSITSCGLLLGSKDGFVRIPDNATKNDATTASTSTITSYVTLPVIEAEDAEKDVLLNNVVVTTAGGASSGTFSDTDGVDVEVYSGEDAETVVEDIYDGATPSYNLTVTGTGKSDTLRTRTRGQAIAIRLHNDTASQTWAVEKVAANIKQTGV